MRPPSQGWGKGKLPPPPLALPPAAAAPARRQRGAPGEAGGGGPRPQSRPQSPAPSRGSAGGAASPPSADAGGIIRRLRAAAWRYFGPFRRGCAALFFFFSLLFLINYPYYFVGGSPPSPSLPMPAAPPRRGACRAVPCRVGGGEPGAGRGRAELRNFPRGAPAGRDPLTLGLVPFPTSPLYQRKVLPSVPPAYVLATGAFPCGPRAKRSPAAIFCHLALFGKHRKLEARLIVWHRLGRTSFT